MLLQHSEDALLVECATPSAAAVRAILLTVDVPGVTTWTLPAAVAGIPGRTRLAGLLAGSTIQARAAALRRLRATLPAEAWAQHELLACTSDLWHSPQAKMATFTSPAALVSAGPLWDEALLVGPKLGLLSTTASADVWVQCLDESATADDRILQLSLRPVMTSGSLWARPRGLTSGERLSFTGRCPTQTGTA
jgi:hypothetical protein